MPSLAKCKEFGPNPRESRTRPLNFLRPTLPVYSPDLKRLDYPSVQGTFRSIGLAWGRSGPVMADSRTLGFIWVQGVGGETSIHGGIDLPVLGPGEGGGAPGSGAAVHGVARGVLPAPPLWCRSPGSGFSSSYYPFLLHICTLFCMIRSCAWFDLARLFICLYFRRILRLFLVVRWS